MRRLVILLSAVAFLLVSSQPPSFAKDGGGNRDREISPFGVNPVELLLFQRRLQLAATLIIVFTLTSMYWLDFSRIGPARDTSKPKKKSWGSRSSAEADEEPEFFDGPWLPVGSIYEFKGNFVVMPEPGAMDGLRELAERDAPVTLTERVDEERQQSFDLPPGSFQYLMTGSPHLETGQMRYSEFSEEMDEAEDIGKLYYGYDEEEVRIHLVIQRSF